MVGLSYELVADSELQNELFMECQSESPHFIDHRIR